MRIFYAMCAISVLCGCAGTPYQHLGVGGGYSDKELATGKWKVRFISNVASTEGFAEKAALYRSAQIMQQAGYQQFAVVDGSVHFNRHYGATSSGGTVSTFSFTTKGQTAELTVVGLPAAAPAPSCEAPNQELCTTFETRRVLDDLGPEMRNAGRRHGE